MGFLFALLTLLTVFPILFFFVGIYIAYQILLSHLHHQFMFSALDVFGVVFVAPFVLYFWKPKDLVNNFSLLLIFLGSVFIGLYANYDFRGEDLELSLVLNNVIQRAFQPGYIWGYLLALLIYLSYAIQTSMHLTTNIIEGININIYMYYFKWKFPVFKAIEEKDMSRLQEFANMKGFFKNVKDPVWQRNPLHWAVILDDEELVKFFIEHEPSLLHRDDHHGMRPLDFAPMEIDEITKCMLANQASILHRRNYNEDTAFINRVVKIKNKELLDFVLTHTTSKLGREEIIGLQKTCDDWKEGVTLLQSQVLKKDIP